MRWYHSGVSRRKWAEAQEACKSVMDIAKIENMSQNKKDKSKADLELINNAADLLNREAEDVLGYQADWEDICQNNPVQ
jgi:hypothetical protein